MARIKEYEVFKDCGKAKWEGKTITNAPSGYQKIGVLFLFAVKHCGKFKGRLVADGHLTKEPMESVYSGVVSLRRLRLVMFLAELNKLLLWGGDVGNAYLEALTKAKLYIIAGPEFGELQGHILIIYKALYRTRTGGACWHDKFFDTLLHVLPNHKRDILTESKGSLVSWYICLKVQSDSGQGSQTSQTSKTKNLTGQELSMGPQRDHP